MLYGLLLVGGKSSRMGEDKATLCYQTDTPEWKRIIELMKPFCNQTFLSCREDQDFPHPCIIDKGDGPLAAIAGAMKMHPNASWLVAACDLPLLDQDTISHLISSRDADSDSTFYASAIDGRPEPLCAIYESSIAKSIVDALEQNKYCPRKLLENSTRTALTLLDPKYLMNANSPAEKMEVLSHLEGTRVEKAVKILYFAQLRELAGTESEAYTTSSVTPAGLYEELKAKYQFPHKQKQLMVAVNQDFATWETELKEGDEVVFIPPVAGG